jgi:hypothetical protein
LGSCTERYIIINGSLCQSIISFYANLGISNPLIEINFETTIPIRRGDTSPATERCLDTLPSNNLLVFAL